LSDAPLLIADLVASVILSGVIGVQRQAQHKPAGFRTHILVGVGACLFMEASRLIGDSRIAAGVITGIGFLGAGAIVRTGLAPHGLTTAASIWVVAAAGLTLGLGSPTAYVIAAVMILLAFIVLSFSDRLLDRWFPPTELRVLLIFDNDALSFEQVSGLFDRDCQYVHFEAGIIIERQSDRRVVTTSVKLRPNNRRALPQILARAALNPGIQKLQTDAYEITA